MTSDTLLIHRRDALDGVALNEASALLSSQVAHHAIDCVNWPSVSRHRPMASFGVACTRRALYVHFDVRENGLRAVNTENLSPVAEDSCVEFFVQVPGSEEYWNFEFNCIGTVNASHRTTRPKPVRLTDEEISRIGRYASLGSKPFENMEGERDWSLTVRIPFDLIGLDATRPPASIRANVYKCGSKTPHPHYLSWKPIRTERPDFHQPAAFGTMELEQATKGR